MCSPVKLYHPVGTKLEKHPGSLGLTKVPKVRSSATSWSCNLWSSSQDRSIGYRTNQLEMSPSITFWQWHVSTNFPAGLESLQPLAGQRIELNWGGLDRFGSQKPVKGYPSFDTFVCCSKASLSRDSETRTRTRFLSTALRA